MYLKGIKSVGLKKIKVENVRPRTEQKGVTIFVIHSPLLLPSFFLGGKIKVEENNQSRGQKSCLCARSRPCNEIGIGKNHLPQTR